jgi:hypothetical protein
MDASLRSKEQHYTAKLVPLAKAGRAPTHWTGVRS